MAADLVVPQILFDEVRVVSSLPILFVGAYLIKIMITSNDINWFFKMARVIPE